MHFRGLIAIVFSVLCLATACGSTLGAPAVSNVTAASSSVGRYDVFTLSFGVSTVATDLYWPYDESPNAGVPSRVGVSVDGLFSNDNWQTTVVQPGFYFQDYQRRNATSGGVTKDWIYPLGDPGWRIRFSPTALGEWKYKIRVTDSGGSTTYDPPNNSFTCVASSNRGFVRVSSKDARYFETDDGSYLNLVGLSDDTTITYSMDSLYSSYATNGVNLLRVWWQGSQGPVLFGMSGQGGFHGWHALSLATDVVRPGELFSGVITGNSTVSTSADVNPQTNYRFSAYVRTVGLVGSGDFGAYLQAFDCTQPDVPLTEKLSGDTDWRQLTATVTTKAGQNTIDGLKIIVSGATAGAAYFTDVSLREDLGNGQYGPELVWRSGFDAQKSVSQLEAWKADYQVELARSKGMYLKVCLQEKADAVFRGIQADGTAGSGDDNNVYASSTHASRTYQQYFWRYMIARYGYATSIHSFEFCNEGDPFNANHYDGASALASYMHTVDPNKAMCTTTFWHSIPMDFWKSSACDYLDVHEYIGPTTSTTASHGPRFFAWGDPRTSDDNSSGTLPFVQDIGTLDLDATGAHSGLKSLKLIATAGTGNVGRVFLQPEYHVGIDPLRSYTLRYWAKASNVGNPGGSLAWVRPGLNLAWSKAYHENDSVSSTSVDAELGTYAWRQYELNGIVPPAGANTANIGAACSCAPDHAGTFWVDDIEFIDEATGRNLYVDGGFEGDHIDYDLALDSWKYGTLLGSYGTRLGKPAMLGETGIRGAKVYGDVYRGAHYEGENQQLVDDASGVWYRKFVWGQINPAGTVDMYWWTGNIRKYGLTRYAKAFQAFMAGIPLSNGHYVDASAVTSVSALRAWGQKCLDTNSAHLWIDNVPYTWKSAVDRVSVPLASGTVTISGLRNGAYRAEWWNTTTGAITTTQDVQCTAGNIVLSVLSLQSDTACKIYPTPAKISLRVLVPSSQVFPGQTVTVTLEYTNTDDVAANNVSLTTRVPAQMTYVAGSAEATGGSYASATGVVSWTVASIAAHQTGTKTFRAKVAN
jgi:uncharacterized repeat protein (TIGR01451 family)